MRTGTKDDVCVVKRCNLTKKQVLAVSPLLPVLGSDVVGYFIHSFRVPNPALNAVHDCAKDVRGNIYVTCVKDGTTHVTGAGDGKRVHALTFVGCRMEEISDERIDQFKC